MVDKSGESTVKPMRKRPRKGGKIVLSVEGGGGGKRQKRVTGFGIQGARNEIGSGSVQPNKALSKKV